MPPVDQDVDGKRDTGRRGDCPDRIVDRVPLEHAERRPGIGDPRRAVELEHRLEGSETRRDHLGAATEPGEEMRFDEAGRDPHVSVQPLAIQGNRHAGDHADVAEGGGIARVVVDDPPPPQDVVAEHLQALLVGARSVRSGRDEHDDVLGPHYPVEDLGDGRQHRLARLRPRRVADRDRDRGLPRRTRSRSGGPCDRAIERGADRRDLVGTAAGWCAGRDDRRVIGDVDLQPSAAVGEA